MSKPKKLQQTFKNINDISTMMIYWTLMGILLLQQIKTTNAAKYKGDSCETKSQRGICKGWSDCPILKTLIDRGEYTSRDVVSCGFLVREELICCPVIRTETKIESTTSENIDRLTDIFVIPTTTTTTQTPERDFWMDVLENINTTTTTTTTPIPDFWSDLLTTTTSTTTMKPLIVGEKRLNESSEFFDFNALLNNNQGGSQKRQVNGAEFQENTGFINGNNNRINNQRPNMQNTGFVRQNSNGNNNRGINLNSGPINLNKWNFEQTSQNQRGNNGNRGHQNKAKGNNGSNGWGQQDGNSNFRGNSGNNGRGHNNGNNGWGQNNGHGPNRNSGHNPNQNRGFVFPSESESHNQLNEFNIKDEAPAIRPNRPVNNMNDQNPNRPIINSNESDKDKDNIEDLIKDVFETSKDLKKNEPRNQPKTLNTNSDKALEDLITNVFKAPQTQSHQSNLNSNSRNPHNNPSPQVEVFNAQPPNSPFQVVPAKKAQLPNNDLETASSTNFAQKHHNHPDPIQMVYENLVNDGLDIVKAKTDHVDRVWNQQQQQFGNRPQNQLGPQQIPAQFGQFSQQNMQQPSQQFVPPPSWQPSQPEFVPQTQFGQQPQFVHQPSQQFVQQPSHLAQLVKDPRSAQAQPSFAKSPNIQSPPSNILDPFKPFEFRPPPADEMNFSEDNNSLSPKNKERPAVRACRRIENGLTPALSPHILGGTPAELGEFPHMAAIGYSRIGGDDRPPYDIRCGGTLIDKRFVLTAAHCVSDRDSVPSIVRLGVVNFTDVEQMKDAVEIRIKETHIHDDYSTRLTYNDIAILELEREVQTSDVIYPVCLYTNEKDPDTKIKLWVSGWGTINTTTRSFSDVLLKAPLHTSPIERCNQKFTDYGLTRKIPDGIIRTQLCAEDKDQIKDACQGDSGGPLHLVVDESYKNYRLVGVVSSGFGCASSTPGLYTRVAAFLDFIERVVWPNACRRFEQNYIPRLVNHVRGGIPADWGEFPFVVALGYSRIGNEGKPPYDIRCGGSLIDKKFVLTAAHCVAKKGDVPSIVRLGVVDFKDVEQMQYAVEIPIKKTFLPDDYRVNSFYNDIAVLELEHEVETNYYIFPVCLYTNETDPDPDIQLWVSGWGTYDAKSQTLSDILLKAPLFTSPLESCNVSFAANGFESKIAHGLQRTQLCAEDKSLKKDSCQGDSGGPLHMPIAAGSRKYRLVGIVSSGFGCASSTPGLYTRVAAYLDFIEPIVWPNGGD